MEISKEKDCSDCGGYGYTVEAECCQNSEFGECCNVPIPVQEPCNKCNTIGELKTLTPTTNE